MAFILIPSADLCKKLHICSLTPHYIPRFVERIRCHEITFAWLGLANSSIAQLNVLQRACYELIDSQSNMQRLLSMILAIGNYINGGTSHGRAYGVK